MKKLLGALMGLSLLIGSATVAFSQEPKKEEKKEQKKKKKKGEPKKEG